MSDRWRAIPASACSEHAPSSEMALLHPAGGRADFIGLLAVVITNPADLPFWCRLGRRRKPFFAFAANPSRPIAPAHDISGVANAIEHSVGHGVHAPYLLLDDHDAHQR